MTTKIAKIIEARYKLWLQGGQVRFSHINIEKTLKIIFVKMEWADLKIICFGAKCIGVTF